MTRRGLSLHKSARWLVGTALVAGAGLLSAITPSDQSIIGPFVVSGDQGAPTASRMLQAQVVSTSFADSIVADGGDWKASANWLVIELEASALQTEERAEIDFATLSVDGLVFRASERVPETLLGKHLHLGTDTTGVLVFELADGIHAGEGELRLTTHYRTPQLDDLLALRVSLDEARRAATVELSEPELGAP